MTNLTDADLAAMEARADAASPGPWLHEDLGGPEWTVWQARTDPHDSTVAHTDLGTDAEFIAAARSDMPALLSEVAALRKQIVLADKAPHADMCGFHPNGMFCTCWKAEYDAAKEALK